jgi:hypothetical protein
VVRVLASKRLRPLDNHTKQTKHHTYYNTGEEAYQERSTSIESKRIALNLAQNWFFLSSDSHNKPVQWPPHDSIKS